MKLYLQLLCLPAVLVCNMGYTMELAMPRRERVSFITPCISQHDKQMLLAPLKSIYKKISDPEIRFNFEKIIIPIQKKEVLTMRDLAYLSCYVTSFDSLVGINLYESEKIEEDILLALSAFWRHFHAALGKLVNSHEQVAQEHALFEFEHNQQEYLHYLDEKQRENERFMQCEIPQQPHFNEIN